MYMCNLLSNALPERLGYKEDIFLVRYLSVSVCHAAMHFSSSLAAEASKSKAVNIVTNTPQLRDLRPEDEG